MDWLGRHKRAICYCLILGGIIAALWFLEFRLIETLLPIILGLALYYNLPRRYVFYLGAFSLLCASLFLAFRQADFASNLSIVAYFSFLTVVIQTVILNRSRRPICFPNGLMFLRSNFNRFLPVLLLIVIVFFASSSLIRTNGDIFAGDFNFPLNYENYLQEHLNLWNEHGSWSQPEVANHTIFLAPFFFVASAFSLTTVAFNKILLVVLLLIAALGTFFFIRKLLIQLNCRSFVTATILPFMAAIFYAFNPWIMGRLGHYFLAVGYAMLPVIVLAFIYALNTRKFHYVVLAALLFAAAGTVPHNVIYIGLVLFIIFWVWFFSGWKNHRLGIFKKYLLPALAVLALFILFSLVWILPTFIATKLAGGGALSPDYMVRVDDIKNAYQDFSFSDIFLSANKDLAQNATWKVAGFLMLIFIPLGFILNIKKRISWVMLLVFIGASIIPIMFLEVSEKYYGVFFSADPGSIFGWLVRDPTRTIILVPFCVIIGLALTLTALERMMANSKKLRAKENIPGTHKYHQVCLWLAMAVIIVLVVFYNLPLARDSLESGFLPVSIPSDYRRAGEQIEENSDQASRVAWYPMQTGAKEFDWSQGKGINNFVDRSFGFRTLGTNSSGGRQFNLLLTSIIENKNPYLGELLDSFNISHLVYRRELIDEKNVNTVAEENYLANVEGINQELATGKLKVFTNNDKSQPININRRTYLVLGGLDALEKLAGLDSVNLAVDSLVFLDQEKYSPEMVQRLADTTDGVIFNDSDELDLTTSLLDPSCFVYPKDFTNRGDYRTAWSKASVNDPLHGEWHDVLKHDFGMSSFDFDYNHGLIYAYTEKPADKGNYYKPKLDIPVTITADGNYTVLVRYFSNPRAENFQFSFDDFSTTIGSFSNSTGFSWQPVFVGDASAGLHHISLTNLGGLNAVSTLAIVPTSELTIVENQARELDKTRVAYLYALGYQNLFDRRVINNSAPEQLLFGLSLKNMNSYKNQFYVNEEDLKANRFSKTDGAFSISAQPHLTEPDSVFSINSQAIAPYYDLVDLLYTPEPESVEFRIADRYSVAVEVKAEGHSKHRRIMTQAIPVEPNSFGFISFSTQNSNVDILSGVVRQYEGIGATTPIRSDKLELASPPNSAGDKKFAKFFGISPKTEFIKLEISTKNNVAGNFDISDLQFFEEDAINKTTGALMAFTPDLFSAASDTMPSCAVIKRSSEKYIVQVTDATRPFTLKFAETYNPLWQAKIDGESLPHITADGIFNAYQIDKAGNFSIEIEFTTQKWMIIGLLITASSIGGLIILAYSFYRRKPATYEKNR